MNGEVYLAEDARGWLVIHESEHGDSSGMEGPFPSYPTAVKAGRDLAARLEAEFAPDRTHFASLASSMLDRTLRSFRRDDR